MVIRMKNTAATRNDGKSPFVFENCCDSDAASVTPITETIAVSFCRPTKSLSSGGITRRTACGMTTYHIVCEYESPSDRAAARWLGCTDSIPARYTSVTYAVYTSVRVMIP